MTRRKWQSLAELFPITANHLNHRTTVKPYTDQCLVPEKLVLFGASTLGRKAAGLLGETHEIVAFVDNDRSKWGQTYEGRPVYGPGVLRNQQDAQVVIASCYVVEIGRQLREMGVPAVVFVPGLGLCELAPPGESAAAPLSLACGNPMEAWATVARLPGMAKNIAETRALLRRDFDTGHLVPSLLPRLALLEAWFGNQVEAERLMEEAYRCDDTLREGFAQLAGLRLEAREWAAARAWLTRDYAGRGLSARWVLRLAEAEAGCGNWPQAEALVAEAYASEECLRDGFARLARLRLAAGDWVNARALLLKDHEGRGLSQHWSRRLMQTCLEESERDARMRELLVRIRPWLAAATAAGVDRALLSGGSVGSRTEFLRNHLCPAGLLELKGAVLEVADMHSLEVILTEILIAEDYRFETDSPRPFIIDAGANFGLATYYFLQRHPGAEVIAFEPDPRMAAMLRRNVERNGWTGVTVVEAALTAREGTQVFHATPGESMAGSLTDRMVERGLAYNEHEVQCLPLSRFLKRSVEFLKLDIEGAEREVLEECVAKLGNVRKLFCEIHRLPGKGHENLSAILRVLENAGFEVELTGPTRLGRSTTRGMENIGVRRSLELWARRK